MRSLFATRTMIRSVFQTAGCLSYKHTCFCIVRILTHSVHKYKYMRIVVFNKNPHNIAEKFYCQPGVIGKKMAVQVIGKIKQAESEEFEELSVEGDESYE